MSPFTHAPSFANPIFATYSPPKYSTYTPQPFYEYANDSSSTSNDDRYYKIPHHGVHPTTPFMSQPRTRTASFSAPRMAAHYKTDYPDQTYYTINPNYKSPPRHHPVSTSEQPRRHRRSSETPHGDGLKYGSNGSPPPKRRSSFRSPTQNTPLGVFEYADLGSTPFYTEIHPRYEVPLRQSQGNARPRRTTSTKTRKTSANPKPSYYQEPSYYEEYIPEKVHVDPSPRTTPKARRSSHSQPEGHHRRKSSTTSPKSKEPSTPKSSTPKPHAKATAKDLERWRIPDGYSTKNWDPTETPILLVGSVFDANSLGKWIYDWTVLHFHAGTPISEMAGEFWLLLIRLAARIKRAKNGKERVRDDDEYELVSEFLLSGRRLWKGLEELVGECEGYMWKQVKKGGKKSEELKKDAGVEFVEAMFGRDRELQRTELLMQKIRTWTHRFDANVDEVLKGKSRS